MAQLLKFSSPVMRSRTGLNADDAPRRLAKEGQDLRPPQLPTDDHRAGCTNPVNLKNRLGDIQTNRCNLLHGWLLSIVIASTATTVWHLDAGGGAVHSIRSGREHLPVHSHAGFATDAGEVIAEGDVDLGEHGCGLGEVEHVHAGGDLAPDVFELIFEAE